MACAFSNGAVLQVAVMPVFGVPKPSVFCTPVFTGTQLARLARSQPVFCTPRWALNPAPGSETFGTWFSPTEAPHHADTEALKSMPATSKVSAGGVFL